MTIYQCTVCGKAHDTSEPACPQTFSLTVPVARTWPEELRARCLAAGYGDVLIGRCDVEGTYANGDRYCLNNHVDGDKLVTGRGEAIILGIVRDLGIPFASASCHWVGLDTDRMTAEQRAAVVGRRYWVSERWMDKHRPRCPRIGNRYYECDCATTYDPKVVADNSKPLRPMPKDEPT